jgi:hypothetical protein
MNKLYIHPYLLSVLLVTFLGLFATNFYYIRTLFELTVEQPDVATNPQYVYELVKSGVSAAIYLVLAGYAGILLAKKSPILEFGVSSEMPELEAEKVEKSSKKQK